MVYVHGVLLRCKKQEVSSSFYRFMVCQTHVPWFLNFQVSFENYATAVRINFQTSLHIFSVTIAAVKALFVLLKYF